MLTISRAPSSDVKLTITAAIPEGGVISYDNWEIGERMPDLVDTESHTRGCRVHRRETQVERAPAELELVHVVAEVEIAAEQGLDPTVMSPGAIWVFGPWGSTRKADQGYASCADPLARVRLWSQTTRKRDVGRPRP
jgi:hypothetical protein